MVAFIATIIAIAGLVAAGIFAFNGGRLYARLAITPTVVWVVSLIIDVFVDGWNWLIYLLPVVAAIPFVTTLYRDRNPAEEVEDDTYDDDDTDVTPVVTSVDSVARAGLVLLTVAVVIAGLIAGGLIVERFNKHDDRLSSLEAQVKELTERMDGVVTHDDFLEFQDEVNAMFATFDGDIEAVKDAMDTFQNELPQNIADLVAVEVSEQLAQYGGSRPVDNPATRRFGNGGSEFGAPICEWVNPNGLRVSELEGQLAAYSEEDVARCVEESDSRLASDYLMLADELTATGLDPRPYAEVATDMQDPAKRLAALKLLRAHRVDTALGCLNGRVLTQSFNGDASEIRTSNKTASCEKDIVVVSVYEVNGEKVRTDRRIHCGGQRMSPKAPPSPGEPTRPPATPTGNPPTDTPTPTTTPTTVPPTTTTTVPRQPKCFKEDGTPVYVGEFCGTPDSGPEQQSPQDNDPEDVAPTPNAPTTPPPPPPSNPPSQEEQDSVGGGNPPPPELEGDPDVPPPSGDSPPPPPPP